MGIVGEPDNLVYPPVTIGKELRYFSKAGFTDTLLGEELSQRVAISGRETRAGSPHLLNHSRDMGIATSAHSTPLVASTMTKCITYWRGGNCRNVLNGTNILGFRLCALVLVTRQKAIWASSGEVGRDVTQSERLVRLPLWVGLTAEQQGYIAKVLTSAIE